MSRTGGLGVSVVEGDLLEPVDLHDRGLPGVDPDLVENWHQHLAERPERLRRGSAPSGGSTRRWPRVPPSSSGPECIRDRGGSNYPVGMSVARTLLMYSAADWDDSSGVWPSSRECI